MSQEIRTVAERVVYSNRFVEVFDNDVLFPSGVSGRYFRTRWKAPYGVAVVPVRNGKVVLVEQYRYAELSTSIEVPQGFGEPGSTPLEDAARELWEETGLKAKSIKHLLTLGRDFENHVFLAEIDGDTAPVVDNAEGTESISRYHEIDLATVTPQTMAAMGIFDALTVSALLSARLSV